MDTIATQGLAEWLESDRAATVMRYLWNLTDPESREGMSPVEDAEEILTFAAFARFLCGCLEAANDGEQQRGEESAEFDIDADVISDLVVGYLISEHGTPAIDYGWSSGTPTGRDECISALAVSFRSRSIRLIAQKLNASEFFGLVWFVAHPDPGDDFEEAEGDSSRTEAAEATGDTFPAFKLTPEMVAGATSVVTPGRGYLFEQISEEWRV